jgi:hypothetical protein
MEPGATCDKPPTTGKIARMVSAILKIKWLRHQLDTRSFPWIILAVLLAMAPVFGLLTWAAGSATYQQDPPSCYGIGWGCKLDAGTSGILWAIIWLVVVAALALVLAVSEFFWQRVAVARSVLLLIALAFGVVASLFVGLWAATIAIF